jgi:hippurate hydrolase
MKTCMVVLFLLATIATAQLAPSAAEIDAIYPDIEALYIDLHRTPELSLQEQKTAAKMADGLRRLGFEITTGVGGNGVVGVLRNGSGPTVMVRTDMDALPVEEKTGLPYASRVKVKDASGAEVGVMHACGHDVHMAAWIGTARLLAGAKQRWRGTLVMIAQPAEELVRGARAMLDDGLFTKFPRPDFAVAIHDFNDLPAGKVGYVSGYMLANVDTVDITIFGKGGHGAWPHTTVDPIVIAARTIVSLQTIVAREIDPIDSAVITVGSIHGGTKHNIIPDEVRLQLTVRSFKDDVRKHLLSAIERVTRAEAAAAAAPTPPAVKITAGASATYNDPKLTTRLVTALRRSLGEANVEEVSPKMGSEDFSEYGQAGVPAVMLWVGAADPAKLEAAKASGTSLPSLHSATFAPDRERTLRTAIQAETAAALELLGKP